MGTFIPDKDDLSPKDRTIYVSNNMFIKFQHAK
jgi:hypothetical protein